MGKEGNGKAPETFGDQFIDLDLFAPTPFIYRVTATSGEERRFPIPTDLPLPLASSFLAAYDPWVRCQFEQLKAKTEKARAAAAGRYTKAWELLLDAFLPIVQLRTPEATILTIRDEIGQNAMATWVMAVANRVDPTHWLELLGMLSPDPKAESAEARPVSSA